MEVIENDISVEWSVAADNPFTPREGQCCCVCGSKLYVFGGVLQTNDGEMTETNELLNFDAETMAWQKVAYKNDAPPPRSAATLSCVGKKLYLFGGLNQDCGWLGDLHVFDTETLTWSSIQAADGPCPRDKLQSVAIDTKIYFFGGFGPKATLAMEDDGDEEYEDEDDEDELPGDQEAAEFGWFNDLFVFDTVISQWSQPLQMNLGVPTPRAAHGLCAVGKNLVIMGGRDTEDRQNDIHIFDTETRKWDMNMKCKGVSPSPRSFHTASAVGNRVVVLGGRGKENQHFDDVNIFDLDAKEWYRATVKGKVPSGRGQQAVGVLGDELIMFGGTSNFSTEIMQCQNTHNDTLILKTDDILKGGRKGNLNGHAEAS